MSIRLSVLQSVFTGLFLLLLEEYSPILLHEL